MKKPTTRLALVIGAGLLLAIALNACGKKGDPVLPKGQTDDYPSSYPHSSDPQTGIFSG